MGAVEDVDHTSGVRAGDRMEPRQPDDDGGRHRPGRPHLLGEWKAGLQRSHFALASELDERLAEAWRSLGRGRAQRDTGRAEREEAVVERWLGARWQVKR